MNIGHFDIVLHHLRHWRKPAYRRAVHMVAKLRDRGLPLCARVDVFDDDWYIRAERPLSNLEQTQVMLTSHRRLRFERDFIILEKRPP